jgi:hypothetical protein
MYSRPSALISSIIAEHNFSGLFLVNILQGSIEPSICSLVLGVNESCAGLLIIPTDANILIFYRGICFWGCCVVDSWRFRIIIITVFVFVMIRFMHSRSNGTAKGGGADLYPRDMISAAPHVNERNPYIFLGQCQTQLKNTDQVQNAEGDFLPDFVLGIRPVKGREPHY